jgi:hypothetical protein
VRRECDPGHGVHARLAATRARSDQAHLGDADAADGAAVVECDPARAPRRSDSPVQVRGGTEQQERGHISGDERDVEDDQVVLEGDWALLRDARGE